MAVGYYQYNPGLAHGAQLRSFLQALELVNDAPKIQANMAQMIDGDGSDPAQFNVVTAQFGFPDNATAKAAWAELNSCIAKLQTDAQVTSVHAAIAQLIAKFR